MKGLINAIDETLFSRREKERGGHRNPTLKIDTGNKLQAGRMDSYKLYLYNINPLFATETVEV